ncbi:hypothetical protein Q8A73_010548 [Channa argus]|nr:hypothetical protein Q8A73_010548 [Channa argus]
MSFMRQRLCSCFSLSPGGLAGSRTGVQTNNGEVSVEIRRYLYMATTFVFSTAACRDTAGVMKCASPAVVQRCAMHDKEEEMVREAWGRLCNAAAATKLQARSHAVGLEMKTDKNRIQGPNQPVFLPQVKAQRIKLEEEWVLCCEERKSGPLHGSHLHTTLALRASLSRRSQGSRVDRMTPGWPGEPTVIQADITLQRESESVFDQSLALYPGTDKKRQAREKKSKAKRHKNISPIEREREKNGGEGKKRREKDFEIDAKLEERKDTAEDGGREDGLVTTDQLKKQEQGRRRDGVMESLTLQQRRSGSNWEGEKKCLLILPREINTCA